MNIYESTPDADLRCLVELADGRCLVSSQNMVLVVENRATGRVVGRLEGAEFVRPEGIAVDRQQGRVLVVDRHGHRVHVFGADLAHLACFGSRGSRNAEFNEPIGIAVSSVDGRIWVADSENHRVQALDRGGAFSASLGAGFGWAPGQLFRPCGIALLDHAQHGELVVVSEWSGGRVQVFRTNGDVVAIFPGVQRAHHVAVEADGGVLVSEYATRKVKRFSLDGEWRAMPASVACIGADWFVMPDRVVARCGKRKYQTEAVV